MLFDSLILAAVADELGRTIVGGKVEKITQPTALDVVVRVYHVGTTHYLLLSADAQLARVHLTHVRRENPPTPPAFCALLRKHLEGAWVHAVSLPLGFGERVLHVEFRAHDGAPLTLIAETMGRLSNLILVSGAGTVLGAAKHIGHDLNRFRQTLPGKPYVAPPRQRQPNKELKRDPLSPADTPPEGEAMSPDEARQWLLDTWAGVSPLVAQEAILRVPHGGLTPRTLWHGLSGLLSVVRDDDYAPRVWSDDTGVTQGAYPIALRSVPTKNQYPRDSISVALDNAAASVGRRDTFAQGRDALLAALRRARKLREREQTEILQGLRNAEKADEYQQSGDLLLANQRAIERGQTSVSVTDYYAPALPTGEPMPRVIALDPSLSAHENAERFFKRSRKARASAASLAERRGRIAEDLSLLSLAECEMGGATTGEQVAAARAGVTALLTREDQNSGEESAQAGKPAKPTGPAFEGHKVKAFKSADGWEILVGENATANDYLTTKLARPSDIWLHVRAATSAHGVIRAQSRPGPVSPAALQRAAELVAARSEVKHSALVPVDYTLKKYVRKPRKSAPGSVTYQNEKTLYVAGIHGE